MLRIGIRLALSVVVSVAADTLAQHCASFDDEASECLGLARVRISLRLSITGASEFYLFDKAIFTVDLSADELLSSSCLSEILKDEGTGEW